MAVEDRQAVNWWVRAQIVLLALLLVAMASFRFWFTEPRGHMDVAFLILLAFVIILILSEAFDTFSVGKVLSISREVRKKEQEVEKLEQKNAQLLSQLITVTTQQAQSLSHYTVSGDYYAAPKVEKATAEEVEENRQSETSARQSQATEAPESGRAMSRRTIDFRQVERFGLEKYAEERGIELGSIARDVKLVSHFQDLDGISNTPLIFDGHIKSADQETFVEIKLGHPSSMLRDRLYMMLSKIQHYARKSGKSARLDLILLDLPSREGRYRGTEMLLRDFQPAIANKLLTIRNITVTEEQEADLRT